MSLLYIVYCIVMNILFQNIETLSKINVNTKLYIEDNRIYIDDRYLISVRRYIEGSSRNDILIPIISTYNSIFNLVELPKMVEKDNWTKFEENTIKLKQLLLKSLEGLKILCQTYYFSFIKLNKVVYWLNIELKKYIETDIDHNITITNFNSCLYYIWLNGILENSTHALYVNNNATDLSISNYRKSLKLQ